MNTRAARLLTALSASFLIGLYSSSTGAAEPGPAASLANAFAFEAHVTIDAPIVVGTGPQGLRRIVPITGGKFEGPRIKGTILNGGADWQYVRGDGVLQIEAKYTLRTSDGVTIMITNRGMRHGPADVIDRLAKGEAVDPSQYYFRTVAEFEAPSDSRYAWLNKALFLATAERQATVVNLRFYELK